MRTNSFVTLSVSEHFDQDITICLRRNTEINDPVTNGGFPTIAANPSPSCAKRLRFVRRKQWCQHLAEAIEHELCPGASSRASSMKTSGNSSGQWNGVRPGAGRWPHRAGRPVPRGCRSAFGAPAPPRSDVSNARRQQRHTYWKSPLKLLAPFGIGVSTSGNQQVGGQLDEFQPFVGLVQPGCLALGVAHVVAPVSRGSCGAG